MPLPARGRHRRGIALRVRRDADAPLTSADRDKGSIATLRDHRPVLSQPLSGPRFLRRRRHPHHRGKRAGEDEPARGGRAAVRPAVLPAGRARRRWPADGEPVRRLGASAARGPRERDAARRRGRAAEGRALHARREGGLVSATSRGSRPAVFLSPEHREILTGAPALRRRFVDRLALLSRPAAGEDLVALRARARRAQRASRARERTARRPTREIEAWTEELVRAGAAVRRHRARRSRTGARISSPSPADAGPEYSRESNRLSFRMEKPRRICEPSVERVLPGRAPPRATRSPDRIATTSVFARHGRPLAVAGVRGRAPPHGRARQARGVARGPRRRPGEPPLLGVDEFDAGLSAAWAEAFVRVAPPDGGNGSADERGRSGSLAPLVGRSSRCGRARVVDRPRAVNEA